MSEAKAKENSALDKKEFVVPQAPEDEFCVFGTVYARPESADRLEELYKLSTRDAADEPGTIYYCIARDSDERHVFHFFERYSGREAFEKHNSANTAKVILSEVDKLFERVEARFTKAIDAAQKGST